MFFKTRKIVPSEEPSVLQKETATEEQIFQEALDENKKIFYEKICHMVHSRPKEREIVVVQRYNIFSNKHHKNEAYLTMAHRMSHEYRFSGKIWICGYYNSLFAFYKPSIYTFGFIEALYKFSQNGYRIHGIRYYKDRF